MEQKARSVNKGPTRIRPETPRSQRDCGGEGEGEEAHVSRDTDRR